MIANRSEAREIALKHLNPDTMLEEVGDEWTVIDKDTIETNFGWLFHVNSHIYAETRNSTYSIKGRTDIFLEKKSGKIAGILRMGSRRGNIRSYEYRRTHSLLSGILALYYAIIDDLIPGIIDLIRQPR